MATKPTNAESKPVAKRPGGRSARVRREVFDSTLRLLAASGYQALTTEAVAADAGVNKTTIYRNWPTKAALVRAAAEDRSTALVSTKIAGDPERDLIAFLTSVANYATSPLGRALVIAILSGTDDPEVREARAGFWRTRFEAAGDLIRTATEGGGATGELDVDAVIEHLIGPLFLRAFITGTPIDQTFIEKTAGAALHLVSCGAVHRGNENETGAQ